MTKRLTFALLALAPLCAFAATPPAPRTDGPPPGGPDRMGGEMFQRADKNKDSVVSRDEAIAAATEAANRMFDRLDTNKDGMLTQEELKQAREDRRAAMQQRFQEHFKAADTNGDGSLSRDEAAKGMPMIAQHFDEIDTNKDGQITAQELQASRDKMMQGMGGKQRGPGMQHGPAPGASSGP